MTREWEGDARSAAAPPEGLPDGPQGEPERPPAAPTAPSASAAPESSATAVTLAPEPPPTLVVVGDGVRSPAMLDVRACAALLGISVRSWQRLVERGEAPKPVKIGKSSRWRRSDVEAFVASRR